MDTQIQQVQNIDREFTQSVPSVRAGCIVGVCILYVGSRIVSAIDRHMNSQATLVEGVVKYTLACRRGDSASKV
jgi:hypothetical protein